MRQWHTALKAIKKERKRQNKAADNCMRAKIIKKMNVQTKLC